jgi:hypothetical protein
MSEEQKNISRITRESSQSRGSTSHSQIANQPRVGGLLENTISWHPLGDRVWSNGYNWVLVLGHAGFCLGFHAVNRGFKGLTNIQMPITNSKIIKWLSCKVNKKIWYMGYFHENPHISELPRTRLLQFQREWARVWGFQKEKFESWPHIW